MTNPYYTDSLLKFMLEIQPGLMNLEKDMLKERKNTCSWYEGKNEEKRYKVQEWGITQVLESTQDAKS